MSYTHLGRAFSFEDGLEHLQQQKLAEIISALPHQAGIKKPEEIMNWIVTQIEGETVSPSWNWRLCAPGDWIWADLAIEIWLLRRKDIGSTAKRRLKVVLESVRELAACKLKQQKAGAQ